MLQSVHLSEVEPDGMIWNLTASGEYSAASTYHAQFEGLISTVFKTTVWRKLGAFKMQFFCLTNLGGLSVDC
jgi:hypothetical protein